MFGNLTNIGKLSGTEFHACGDSKDKQVLQNLSGVERNIEKHME